MYEDDVERGLGVDDICVKHSITCPVMKGAIKKMVFAYEAKRYQKRLNRQIAQQSKARRKSA